MTTRERWFLTGLVLAFFGLAALGVWNQARYQDVREAVNKYVALDAKQEQEGPEKAALVRQAWPEVRRSLTRGEFEDALKRLKSLEEEDAGADGAKSTANALPLGKLWPADSPERKRLQGVLQELVRKQAEGYDVQPAQRKLVELAQAAREGKKDQALALFDQADALVRDAPLRPGFRAKVNLAAAAPGTPGATITPAELQQIEKAVQQFRMFRTNIPQAMNAPNVTEPQRHAFSQLQVLLDELIAAHEQKRDLRSLMKLGDVIGKAIKRAGESGEWGEAESRIQMMRAAVKSLPQLPPVAQATPGAPAPPAPGTPPPGPPPAAPPGQPASPAANLLRMIDFIRALPEEKYQAERPKIGAGIAQMLAAAGHAAGPPGEPVGKDLQLLLGPQGEVAALQLFGEVLGTAGQKPGGITVQLEGQPELPIRTPLVKEGEARRLRLENAQGAVSLLITPGPTDLTLKIAGRRGKGGPPAFLNLSVPARLGGWYWQPGAEQQPMTVDHDYRLRAADGKLPKLVVGNGAAQLAVDAPTAAEVAYVPAESRLLIRLPLTLDAGTAEHVVRLTAVRPAAAVK